MSEFELLSTVAVLRDIPEDNLVRGQVGTVVEELVPGACLVEFSDKTGHPYAVVAIKSEDLMQLHYGSAEQPA